jgi:hypothetical protein
MVWRHGVKNRRRPTGGSLGGATIEKGVVMMRRDEERTASTSPWAVRLALLSILTGAALIARASAEETEGPMPLETSGLTLQQLAKAKQNPFTEKINVPIDAVPGFGIEPRHDVGVQMTIQPLVPVALDADWSLIVRPLLQATYSPEPRQRFGLGDVQPSFFVTPARTAEWDWGVGPALQFPTATSNELGTGKWSAGPTGALFYSEGPWLGGAIVTQLRSFAGAHRTAVNQTSTEVQLSYNFESGWYVQTDPTITYDWSAAASNAWTLPIGLDIGKVTKIGGQNVSLQIGGYDALKRPTGAPQWIIRAEISFLFPR